MTIGSGLAAGRLQGILPAGVTEIIFTDKVIAPVNSNGLFMNLSTVTQVLRSHLVGVENSDQ